MNTHTPPTQAELDAWRRHACLTVVECDRLITEVERLTKEVEELRELLRFIAFQRLPLGDKVIEHLPDEWQAKVNAAMQQKGEE